MYQYVSNSLGVTQCDMWHRKVCAFWIIMMIMTASFWTKMTPNQFRKAVDAVAAACCKSMND